MSSIAVVVLTASLCDNSSATVSTIAVTYLTTSVILISSATVLSSSVMYSMLCISTTARLATLTIECDFLTTDVTGISSTASLTLLLTIVLDVSPYILYGRGVITTLLETMLFDAVAPSSTPPIEIRANTRFSTAVASSSTNTALPVNTTVLLTAAVTPKAKATVLSTLLAISTDCISTTARLAVVTTACDFLTTDITSISNTPVFSLTNLT